MNNKVRFTSTALVASALVLCASVAAGAQGQGSEARVALPEYSTADTVKVSSVSRAVSRAAEDCTEDINYYFVSPADEDTLASEIAGSAVLRESTLADGKRTVNISVDFEQGNNRALLNNRVLRKTAKKLVEAENSVVAQQEQDEFTLMDRIHIVGETELHLIGYEVSKALGGGDGALSGIYESCRVADLNVDEARFGGLIRVFGVLYSGIG